MIKPYRIEFVAHDLTSTMVPTLDAFRFKPKGHLQWLQRLAWKFLNWCCVLHQAYEPKVTVNRHLIDADTFMDRLFKQKLSLFDSFHKEGQKLLIGSDDYFELMTEKANYQPFNFQAEFMLNKQLFGLTVEVIPWMRGMIVMP